MELIDIQIAQIRNLNLIYIYNAENVVDDTTNKYIGARITYDDGKTISLDYKDNRFEKFIEKIIETYNTEKQEREIILLGDLTKNLIETIPIKEDEEKEFSQNNGIPYFNTEDKNKSFQINYLKEAIREILQCYKNYEMLQINDIKGYNYKYSIDYNIATVRKQIPLIIIKQDDKLNFILGRINNLTINVDGMVENMDGKVLVTWKSNKNNINGQVLYDATKNFIQKKVEVDSQVIYYDDKKELITENDNKILEFYFNLSDLELPENIIKIDNNSFITSNEVIKENDKEGVLYENTSTEILLTEDEVKIKSTKSKGLNKYHGGIQVVLDKTEEYITFKKVEIENELYLLMEKCNISNKENNYTYEVFPIKKDIKLNHPFETEENYKIDEEVKSLESVKKYIKKRGEIK